MRTTQNSGLGRSYRHGSTAPCSTRYLARKVVALCRQFSARRVLDVGCGNGWLCRCLADEGFLVVGMDPDESGIRNARTLVPEGIFYQVGVYEDPSVVVEDGFDVVVTTECLEHLFSPSSLLSFAKVKLGRGGCLVLSTPYHGYLKNLLIALAGRWDAHHDSLREGGHIKFWSKRTLIRLLAQTGFEVIESHGVGRVPLLWKSMVVVGRRAGSHGLLNEPDRGGDRATA